MYFVIDTSSIERNSQEERFRAYDTALKSGWMQIDEVRKAENLSPIGLDLVKLNLSDVLYNPTTKELYVTNTNTTVAMGKGTIAQKGGENNAD